MRDRFQELAVYDPMTLSFRDYTLEYADKRKTDENGESFQNKKR